MPICQNRSQNALFLISKCPAIEWNNIITHTYVCTSVAKGLEDFGVAKNWYVVVLVAGDVAVYGVIARCRDCKLGLRERL